MARDAGEKYLECYKRTLSLIKTRKEVPELPSGSSQFYFRLQLREIQYCTYGRRTNASISENNGTCNFGSKFLLFLFE